MSTETKPQDNKKLTLTELAEIPYGDFVMSLCKPGQNVKDDLTFGTAHLLHMAIGVAGESGELLDAVKRCAIYGKELDMENVVEELGDLMFYMQGIMQSLGITQETVIIRNKLKLVKRYESGYSNSAAQARADKS